jgi:hypothetical protein
MKNIFETISKINFNNFIRSVINKSFNKTIINNFNGPVIYVEVKAKKLKSNP